MKPLLPLFCSLLLVSPALAQQPGGDNQPPQPPRRIDRPFIFERLGGDEAQTLARPVKIQFRLDPKEEKDKPFWVVTATGRFAIAASFDSEGKASQMQVDGRVRMQDEKLMLTYKAEIGMKAEKGGGRITVEGSVPVMPGKEKTLAGLGDKSLVVLVTYEDAEK